MASQAQRLNVTSTSSNHQGNLAGSRVNRFLQLDPLIFTGTKPKEDPHEFIDEMQKTLHFIHATKTEAVELVSYYLKEVAHA